MALDQQTVPIALGQGINTKDDPKQLSPGKLTVLHNGVFQVGHEINKRNGYEALSRNIISGGTIAAGVDVSTFQNELTELDGSSLYSYNDAGSNWVNKGTLVTTTLSTSTVVRNTTEQSSQDSAINGNYRCFVWYDSVGQIGYSIFDTETGQSVVNNQAVDANGIVAKVLTFGSNFVIIYFESSTNKLKYKLINTATPTSISAAVDIATDINTTYHAFDATIFNSRIYIAYGSTTSSRINMYYLDSGFTKSSQLVVTTSFTPSTLTVFGDSSNNAWVGYSAVGLGNRIYAFIANANLTSTVVASTQIDVPTGSGARNITGIASGTVGTFYYECLQSNSFISTELTPNRLRTSSMTLSGTAGTASSFIRGVGLASKVFSYNGVNYLWATFESNLQSSYFLLNGSAAVVAKLSPDLGGGYTEQSILPEVNVVSSGVYQTASLVKDLLFSSGGDLFTQTGVLSAQVSFLANAPATFVLGENLHVPGGIINMYDGANVVEHGYSIYPEGLSGTMVNSGTGGGIGPGVSSATVNDIQYSAVYEWTDNQGQIHRSAPSIPITLSVPNANAVVFTGNYTSATPGTIFSPSSTAGLSVGQTVYALNLATSPHLPVLFNSGTISTISGSITGSFSSALLSASGSLTFLAVSGNAYLFSVNILAGSKVGTLTYDGGVADGQVVFGAGANLSVFPSGTTIDTVLGSTITFSNPANIDSPNGNIAFYTTNANTATIFAPTLKLTSKPKVSIALYRTEVNGTVFYRQSSLTSLTYNDKTADAVIFTDSTPDAVLIGNEQLYTTGEIENIEAPAISAATTFKNRAIVIPSESKYAWQFSKQVIPGSPVEFSDQFLKNVDARIGSITAVGVLDEKIIFFGPGSKYYVVGDGPSASGANDDFSQAQHITGSTGCSNQSSLIEVPVGLIYQDPTKGIYLLDRSLQEQYIGQEVEAYNSDPVTSAQTIPGTTSVRFTLTSGSVLVYDWFYGQWGSDPYQVEAIGSTISDGRFTYVQANGLVLRETPGTYTDNGSFIPLSLKTGWINFAGVQGFQRVLQLSVLGEYKSPHDLVVNIYSDFDDTTPTQTVTIPVNEDPGNYEYRIRIVKQKCTSIKIEVSDSQSSNFGEGMSLSSLSFIVGVKKGLNKLPAGKSY